MSKAESGASHTSFFVLATGIDMPTKEELIATRHSDLKEIAKEIGADRIFYQDLDDLQE